MNTIGGGDRRPASSSGKAGSSQAMASSAGNTVTAPNSHPARPGFFSAVCVSDLSDPCGTWPLTHAPTIGPVPESPGPSRCVSYVAAQVLRAGPTHSGGTRAPDCVADGVLWGAGRPGRPPGADWTASDCSGAG